jgi:hypothetical protein
MAAPSETLASAVFMPPLSRTDLPLKRPRPLLSADEDGDHGADKRPRTDPNPNINLITATAEMTAAAATPPTWKPLASAPPKPSTTSPAPAPINRSIIGRRIREALGDGFSKRVFSYAAAAVLMLWWEDDDAEVRSDAASLEDVFRSVYHFSTEHLALAADQPDGFVTSRVAAFLRRHVSSEKLVVCYFAGHAKPSPRAGEAPLWTSCVSLCLLSTWPFHLTMSAPHSLTTAPIHSGPNPLTQIFLR